MINTEIFEFSGVNNYDCFERTLKMVNDLIKEKRIKKSDIIEYKTRNWETKNGDVTIWHSEVTISWWE